jgi:threonine/homoserine/homoserine lactone efflux protein
MTAFVPDTATLLAYSVACFVLFVTPGPDMSLFLAKTVTGGRRAGIAAMSGASLGSILHAFAAALGISALIAASPQAFLVLKIVGAAYLVWLAVDAIRRGSALSVDAAAARRPEPVWRTLVLGVLVNLSNPKVILFFVTFLPQFVDAADPAAAGKLFFLGIYFVVFSFPLAVAMILAAERVLGALGSRPRLVRALDWAFAGVFGAFALKILIAQNR